MHYEGQEQKDKEHRREARDDEEEVLARQRDPPQRLHQGAEQVNYPGEQGQGHEHVPHVLLVLRLPPSSVLRLLVGTTRRAEGLVETPGALGRLRAEAPQTTPV